MSYSSLSKSGLVAYVAGKGFQNDQKAHKFEVRFYAPLFLNEYDICFSKTFTYVLSRAAMEKADQHNTTSSMSLSVQQKRSRFLKALIKEDQTDLIH